MRLRLSKILIVVDVGVVDYNFILLHPSEVDIVLRKEGTVQVSMRVTGNILLLYLRLNVDRENVRIIENDVIIEDDVTTMGLQGREN